MLAMIHGATRSWLVYLFTIAGIYSASTIEGRVGSTGLHFIVRKMKSQVQLRRIGTQR